MLAKVSSFISLVLVNTMVVGVGSPRLHAYSRETEAFLSESINRVIITGIYLGATQTSCFQKQNDIQTYTMFPLSHGERSVNKEGNVF